ncbi:MAG: VOC family protein [Dehalococcoidia bacterium]|nr:VOC family protein [Dehalococcoidia bacterium]
MNVSSMILNEIAEAVNRENYERTKAFYEQVLGLDLAGDHVIVKDTPGEALMATYLVGPVAVNVMAPTGTIAVTLLRSLEKQGEGLHHICWCIGRRDYWSTLKRFGKFGIRLVDPTGGAAAKASERYTAIYSDPRVTHGVVHEVVVGVVGPGRVGPNDPVLQFDRPIKKNTPTKTNAIYVNEIDMALSREKFETAKKFYEEAVGLQCVYEGVVYKGTAAESLMAAYPIGHVSINLLTPTGPNSAILNRSLAKRTRGLHHTGFYVDSSDMKGIAERCKEQGIRVVGPTGDERWDTHFYTDPRTMPNRIMHMISCVPSPKRS